IGTVEVVGGSDCKCFPWDCKQQDAAETGESRSTNGTRNCHNFSIAVQGDIKVGSPGQLVEYTELVARWYTSPSDEPSVSVKIPGPPDAAGVVSAGVEAKTRNQTPVAIAC